jgi:hypothetical protein
MTKKKQGSSILQRQESEQLLFRLRTLPNGVELCKYIIETSSVPYAQFQATISLREIIVRDWHFYNKDKIKELLHYWLEFLHQRHAM